MISHFVSLLFIQKIPGEEKWKDETGEQYRTHVHNLGKERHLRESHNLQNNTTVGPKMKKYSLPASEQKYFSR
jgi:hypothetical protein